MVIVYATTRYVSRYFPALDTILTFPVVYHYSTTTHHYNMTNDSTASSGVIFQKRPSVIKAVPRHDSVVDESECEERIDVVGDRLNTNVEEEEERIMTGKKRVCSTEIGNRESKRRMVERNGISEEDGDWKPPENKRHKCGECGMRFKKPSALVIHLRTHSGEKPYHCEHCDKRFSISGNLRRHMFTHTGEKPYKCQACGRAFNNPSHLARHSKKIHI